MLASIPFVGAEGSVGASISAASAAEGMLRHLTDAASSAFGRTIRPEVLPLIFSMVSFAAVAAFAGVAAFGRDDDANRGRGEGGGGDGATVGGGEASAGGGGGGGMLYSSSGQRRGRRQRGGGGGGGGSPNESQAASASVAEEGRASAGVGGADADADAGARGGGTGGDWRAMMRASDHRRARSNTPPPPGHPGGGGGGGGGSATPPTPGSEVGTECGSVDSASGSKRAPRSSGDSTRRAFYKLIFIALVSRLILLPIEAFYLSPASSHVQSENGMCTSSPMCIFSRTLPDLAFASAFSLLVLFYAQLAGTAAGGGPRGLSSILMRRGLFEAFNAFMYGVYGLLFLFTGILTLIPYEIFQAIVWSMLCLIYLLLFATLSFFGPVLVLLLRPSLARRSALACRLIFMCVLCAVVFLSRTLTFGLAVWKADVRYTHGVIPNLVIPLGSYGSMFGRDALGYALLELLPSLAILIMMHQPRKAGDGNVRNAVAMAPHSQSPGIVPASGLAVGAVAPASNARPHGGGGGGIGVVGGVMHHHIQPHQQIQYHHGHLPAGLDVGIVGGMRRVTSGSAPKRSSAGGGVGVGNRGAMGLFGHESASLLPSHQGGGSPAYGAT